MKKLLIITILLLTTLTLNASTQRDNAEAFVERFYDTILSRPSDAGGLQSWSDALIANEKSGEDIARGFINSPEFMDKNTTDSEYITVLYRAFFDREGDAGGVASWLYLLEGQRTRRQVLGGFLFSDEFEEIAKNYGIVPAFTPEILREIKKEKIDVFTRGLYVNVLNREPDTEGQAGWTNGLIAIRTSGEIVLTGFFSSAEFIGRDTSDEAYVEILYQTFFHRSGDAGGVAYWLEQLNTQSREQVLKSFILSSEFHTTAQDYGFYATTAEALQDPNNRIPIANGGSDDGFVLDLSDGGPCGEECGIGSGDGIDPTVNMG